MHPVGFEPTSPTDLTINLSRVLQVMTPEPELWVITPEDHFKIH